MMLQAHKGHPLKCLICCYYYYIFKSCKSGGLIKSCMQYAQALCDISVHATRYALFLWLMHIILLAFVESHRPPTTPTWFVSEEVFYDFRKYFAIVDQRSVFLSFAAWILYGTYTLHLHCTYTLHLHIVVRTPKCGEIAQIAVIFKWWSKLSVILVMTKVLKWENPRLR